MAKHRQVKQKVENNTNQNRQRPKAKWPTRLLVGGIMVGTGLIGFEISEIRHCISDIEKMGAGKDKIEETDIWYSGRDEVKKARKDSEVRFELTKEHWRCMEELDSEMETFSSRFDKLRETLHVTKEEKQEAWRIKLTHEEGSAGWKSAEAKEEKLDAKLEKLFAAMEKELEKMDEQLDKQEDELEFNSWQQEELNQR